MTRRRRRDSRRGRGWRGTAWGQLPRGLRAEGQLRWPVRGRCLERARPVEPGCPSGGGGYPLSGAASWRGEPRSGGGGVAVADSWGSRMESGSREVEGKRERGSGEAVARKATLGQAWFLRGRLRVAKPGGQQRPPKQCQGSKGKLVRSGGLEKHCVKQFVVSRP